MMRTDTSSQLDVLALLHDLRTPLSTIELSATLLGRGDLAPELAEVVRRLKDAAHDVLALAERALALSHPVQAPDRHPAVRVELWTICERVIQQAHVLHPERRVIVSGSRPVVGLWDPVSLQELVQNLIMNALEHGKGDVAVAIQREDSGVVVRVTSAGAPIPRHIREAIFEPFASGGGNGHGLGLHIARRAAEQNGGTLTVRSEPPGSNVFEVTLAPLG